MNILKKNSFTDKRQIIWKFYILLGDLSREIDYNHSRMRYIFWEDSSEIGVTVSPNMGNITSCIAVSRHYLKSY